MNPVCPYCRTEIGSGEGERLDCPGCGTPHHPECFAENGGCTVFGCSKAPVDEPKISVSGTELAPPAAWNPAPQAQRLPANWVPRPSVLALSGNAVPAPQVSAPAPVAPPAPASSNGGASVPPPPPPPGMGAAPPPMPGAMPPPNASVAPAPYVPQLLMPGPGLYAPPRTPGVYSPLVLPDSMRASTSKSRVVFVLLGIFLGMFGVHNFYAGYTRKAVIQLCITLLSFFYAAVVSWVWAIIEVCVINEDYDGAQFS